MKIKKQCERCNKINPAEIHTCTPGFYGKDGKIINPIK